MRLFPMENCLGVELSKDPWNHVSEGIGRSWFLEGWGFLKETPSCWTLTTIRWLIRIHDLVSQHKSDSMDSWLLGLTPKHISKICNLLVGSHQPDIGGCTSCWYCAARVLHCCCDGKKTEGEDGSESCYHHFRHWLRRTYIIYRYTLSKIDVALEK